MKPVINIIRTVNTLMRLGLALAAADAAALAQPVITFQPTNQIVPAGGSVTFSTAALGSGPLSYQWRFNGTNLANIINIFASQGFREPFAMTFDRFGNLLFSDGDGGYLVRKIGPGGEMQTVAGNGSPDDSGDGGQATDAGLWAPQGLAFDSAGNLFIADRVHNRVRKVQTNGVITTVAGSGVKGYSGDGGAATNALLNNPRGVAIDGSDNLFISDSNNNVIRKVSADGTITTVAGTGIRGYFGDGGFATNAQLGIPTGLIFDRSGNLYLADSTNHCVRKIGTNGVIITIAGNGVAGNSGDGGAATNALLNVPQSVVVDDLENLYIADASSHRVRKVDADGIITAFAGNGVVGDTGDGGPAVDAEFTFPRGLALDAFGNLFIGYSERIREVFGSFEPTLRLENATANNAGNYDVVVTDLSGRATSHVATLTVLPPPSLKAGTDGGNTLRLTFQGVPGQSYILQATSSLEPRINWQPVYTNAVGLSGIWSFTLAPSSNQMAGFYRLGVP